MCATGPTTATLEALGTYVFISTRSPEDLRRAEPAVREILKDVDETCSRFRDDSDLSRVNNHPGEWVEVDLLLVAAVAAACEAAHSTDGLVNPLLGRPLVQLGYDRDFTLLAACENSPVESAFPELDGRPEVTAWQRIRLDPQGALRIPTGTALDLGATAKAWAADLIGSAFLAQLSEPALVSLGGDIRISAEDGRPWQIAISEDPAKTPDVHIGLDGGGLATSSTRVRHWRRGGVRRHHLIDPRTGVSATEVWRTVTATGPTCVAANMASTAAIVLGNEAPGWLADRGVSARLVSSTGEVCHVGAWPAPESRSPPLAMLTKET